MQRVFRPLAVFVIATAVGVAVGLRAAMIGGATGSSAGDAFPTGYDLAEIELVRATLYHVDQSYVDPSRIDWDAMVGAGLDAVEVLVPSVMFTRSDSQDTLAVDVGDYHTVIDARHAVDRQGAEALLEQVAGILADHLSPRDLPDETVPTGGAPMARVEYALVNGMLATLDPHTMLLPPDAAHEMDLDNQGEFGGLGITIEIDEEHRQLSIECPIPGTPAAQAGIQPGDRVLRIDGESTVNMTLDDAIELLRGPEGSVAHLVVARAGSEEALSIDVERALIDSNPVESALLEGNVGWIRIQSFHEKVASDVIDALGSLHREARGELAGLVLDVRGNPGGFLTQAVRVADVFLEEGDIVSTVDAEGRETEAPEVATAPAEPRYPIVVLVDAHSASASEILAGALRYNERAVVVGERTFGKGSVQNLQTFYDDSKLKLTISRYLTPGERSIQGVGIPADVELVPSAFGDAPSLFHRERVRREADLEAGLDAWLPGADEPAFRLRYVASRSTAGCEAGPDLATDRELALSRLLVVSAGKRWRRPDVLSAVAPVLANQRRAFDRELVERFAALDVPWADGPAAPRDPSPDPKSGPRLEWSVGRDGVLHAGASEPVSLTVTNRGPAPIHRLAVVLGGDSVVGGEELFFGQLGPGESRTRSITVEVPRGEPSEHAVATVSVRDAGPGELARSELPIDVFGAPLPRLEWTVSPTDSGGDGRLDAGEELRLAVTLHNTGGDAVAPFVRLRNRSGTHAELLEGRFEPGPLQAGGSVSGVLVTRVSSEADLPALSFDLEVGDDAAFDRGAIVVAEHYELFQQRQHLTFVPGEALRAEQRSSPPTIDVTRDPGREATGRVTVSGLVSDDEGLAQVLVFVNGDKVFTEGRRGGATFRTVPFTADVVLEPGDNTIVVLAEDSDGLSSGRSVVVWSDEAPVLAKAPPE